MKTYSAKARVIIELHNRGYIQDFALANDGILNLQESELIRPEEFEITETFRMESTKKLNDTYIIYAIRSFEQEVKGILMTSLRSFETNISLHLWAKLAKPLRATV